MPQTRPIERRCQIDFGLIMSFSLPDVDSSMHSTDVFEQEVTVLLENGLHLVPCSRIAELARRFPCQSQLIKDGIAVDAKTIFDLITLQAVQGTKLTIRTQGQDARELLEKLVELFAHNFET